MTETITVVGNITEPELKTTDTGLQILSFRLASTERRFEKGEEKWVEGATNWYSVSAFRQLADNAGRSLRKGDRVVVTGRLRLRDWETAAKKGVTAQIDADALGHDLRWGTTTFHRAGAPAQGSPSQGTPSQGAPAKDEWPVETPAQPGDPWSAEDEGATAREGSEHELASAETPY